MPSIHTNPLFSRAEIGILACSKCRKPMRLAYIEPASPGFDVRTFECSECNTIERFTVAI
jgi:RNase P subunit RPR2